MIYKVLFNFISNLHNKFPNNDFINIDIKNLPENINSNSNFENMGNCIDLLI